MDYYKIGQKIRKIRKAHGLSQEELAEKVNISTTHMSHIETGKTKLALPTIVKIANALSVSTDELLCDSLVQTQHVYDKKIAEELKDCDNIEIQAFLEIIQSTKKVLRKNRATTT